jgi:sulfate adenylyltransferase subunit 1
MDLVDFDKGCFEKIKNDYIEFSERLDIRDITYVPISALLGDNVVTPSRNMQWYDNGTLLEVLESIEIANDHNFTDGRFPVQYVIRPLSDEYHDYRGYAGRVAGGSFMQGDEIIALPSLNKSTIKSVDIYEGSLEEAYPPQSVTLTLNDDIDISRGDMIVKPDNMPEISQEFDVMMCWMNEKPLQVNGKYALKHTTREVRCLIKEVQYKVNVNNLEHLDDTHVGLNDIARVTLKTTKPVFIDSYKKNRRTGALIIIDEATNNTVGVGMVI